MEWFDILNIIILSINLVLSGLNKNIHALLGWFCALIWCLNATLY